MSEEETINVILSAMLLFISPVFIMGAHALFWRWRDSRKKMEEQ